MDEEEILKRMTSLLEQGCTMLAAHHSCGATLFRCKGEVVCPACSFGVEAEPRTGKAGERTAVEAAVSNPTLSQMEKPVQDMSLSGVRTQPAAQSSIKENVSVQPNVQPSVQRDQSLVEGSLRESILIKIGELADDIKGEHDLVRLRSLLDCVEEAVKVLRALER